MVRLVATKWLLAMLVSAPVAVVGSPVNAAASAFQGITCKGFTANGATTGQFTRCNGNTGGYSMPFPTNTTMFHGGPITWANGLTTTLSRMHPGFTARGLCPAGLNEGEFKGVTVADTTGSAPVGGRVRIWYCEYGWPWVGSIEPGTAVRIG